MKRLNKITLILMAVMGIVISGCGDDNDIKKAPYVMFEHKDSGYIVMPINNLDIQEQESEEIYKKLKVKKITLLGKKECPLQDISEKSGGFTAYGYKVKNKADCPPKDRAKKSYEVVLKTNYGTFSYDISNDSLKTRRYVGNYYTPNNANGGNK